MQVRLTNGERILIALDAAGRPLSDAELAEATGIAPRAQVNQLCNKLARAGRTIRQPGPEGHMLNRLPQPDDVITEAATPSGGSSHEQQAAEALILELLKEQVGEELRPQVLASPSGATIKVDGVSNNKLILVECWAHQGPAKVAQKYKLVNDAVKLHWAATWMAPTPSRLILCVTDKQAVRHLRGRSWQGQAISSMGVEVVVVQLPPQVVAGIVDAQKRQFR